MAQTIADITISDTWVNLNTASGISVGDEMKILNKSPTWVRIAEGTEPALTSTDGLVLTDMDRNYAQLEVPSGSLTIWAKTTQNGRTIKLSVQPA